MSQENVELAKRVIALWNRGDMDALRERYDPEAVMHHPPELEMTVLADPGDWIVWEYRWTAIGLESGLPMELVGAQATRYSAGQIVEVRFYPDRAEALEAVGLRE